MVTPFKQKTLISIFGCLMASAYHAQAITDVYPDIRFGPYVLNEIQMAASPSGNEKVLPQGNYRLQVGWIEPITLNGFTYAACTFLETDIHADISPYQTDIGTTFSLKPFRIFEAGLTYNRLIFNGSLIGFNYDSFGGIPNPNSWSAQRILTQQPGEPAGADVFAFTGAFHITLSRFTLYLAASRSLWDVDLRGYQLLYEYGSDLLIRPRDRINTATSVLQVSVPTWKWLKPFTLQGVFISDRYWYTTNTHLEKNIAGIGFSGLRYGGNSRSQKRGLDFTLGYFTTAPQLDNSIWWRRLHLAADWKWTVDFLSAQTL